jgi:hypothetical protein
MGEETRIFIERNREREISQILTTYFWKKEKVKRLYTEAKDLDLKSKGEIIGSYHPTIIELACAISEYLYWIGIRDGFYYDEELVSLSIQKKLDTLYKGTDEAWEKIQGKLREIKESKERERNNPIST